MIKHVKIENDSTFFENNPLKGVPYTPPTPEGLIALQLQTFLYQADWFDKLADTLRWNPEIFDSSDVKRTERFSAEFREVYRQIGYLYDMLIERHGMEDLSKDPQINQEAKQQAQITLDQDRRFYGLPTWDYPEGKPRRIPSSRKI